MRSFLIGITDYLHDLSSLERDRFLVYRRRGTYFRPLCIHQDTDTVGYGTDVIYHTGQPLFHHVSRIQAHHIHSRFI